MTPTRTTPPATTPPTLVITAHPESDSLTQRAALRLQEVLGDAAVLAPLAEEAFDPRFTVEDRQAYTGQAGPAADVVAEQRRVDAAEHLVLVFPVYWWSMPALLKGWIDRVLIAGWAFDIDGDGRVVPRLGDLTVHLLPVSGTSAESFARHGYTQSFATQIEHGVIAYCGARQGATAFIHDSESGDRAATERAMEESVDAVVRAITGGRD